MLTRNTLHCFLPTLWGISDFTQVTPRQPLQFQSVIEFTLTLSVWRVYLVGRVGYIWQRKMLQNYNCIVTSNMYCIDLYLAVGEKHYLVPSFQECGGGADTFILYSVNTHFSPSCFCSKFIYIFSFVLNWHKFHKISRFFGFFD